MLGSLMSSRLFHMSRTCLSVEKSALASLRKATGYTFANCKKALELHNNDVKEAEKWLREEAQKLGWSKAQKVEGRTTAQGLIGVLVKNNIGALVEVNCETDFVARNKEFQKFIQQASESCHNYMSSVESKAIIKIGIGSDALKDISCQDGKTLGDHLALLIGTVGENATLKRAICYKAPESVSLVGYAHSTSEQIMNQEDGPLFGKYGAIAAFKVLQPPLDEGKQELQKKILQHIVGMNPVKVGDKESDEPESEKDDEKCLIYQEYLLDPELVVGELLEEQGLQVLDFQRFACGEQESQNQSVEQRSN
uniref:Elongation factor Ts, mitochondrial n=1 Tax=Culicoides sonorensis TaxID=179676 RepID=A0A336L310_CULSO